MDTHEFRILISEYFERIETAIGRLPTDGIEACLEEAGLRIMFEDGKEILLDRNDEFQRITLRSFEGPTHYYFNETEEDWYAVGRETVLLADISAALSSSIGADFSLEIA